MECTISIVQYLFESVKENRKALIVMEIGTVVGLIGAIASLITAFAALIKLTKKDEVAVSFPEDTGIIKDRKDLVIYVKEKIIPNFSNLNQNTSSQVFSRKINEIASLEKKPIKTPVAIIGTTGIGKTTLLNAVMGEIIGTAGLLGAQSASTLVVSYNPEKYLAKISYSSLSEVQSIVKGIFKGYKVESIVDSDGKQLIPENISNFLRSILKSPNKVSPTKISLNDLHDNIAQNIKAKKVTIEFELEEIETLRSCVREHTSTNGQYWAITDEVRISGPFPGLSDGIEIMDLPGVGELNPLRIHKTREALKEKASQTVIVVGPRGFLNDVKEMLQQTHLISYLLTSPNVERVTIVGTQLDKGLTDPSITEELNIPASSNPNAILKAIYSRWIEMVKSQWKEILETQSSLDGMDSDAMYRSVEQIINTTEFVPSSAIGYLWQKGLVGDPFDLYSKIFSEKDGLMDTGIPQVREALKRLISKQQNTREDDLNRMTSDLHKRVINDTKNYLQIVEGQKNISRETISLIDSVFNEISGILSKLRNEDIRFEISEQIETSLEKIHEKFQAGYNKLGKSILEELLSENYSSAYYQTIQAALRRGGEFESAGYTCPVINLPENIGYYVAPPVAGYVNETILNEFKKKAIATISDKIFQVKTEIESTITVSLSNVQPDIRSLINSSIAQLLDYFNEDVQSQCINSTEIVNELERKVLEHTYQAISIGITDVLQKALMVSGEGARRRTLETIAEEFENNKTEISRLTSSAFSEEIEPILQSFNNQLEEAFSEQIRDIVERVDETKITLQDTVKKDKETEYRQTVDELTQILEDLESYGGVSI